MRIEMKNLVLTGAISLLLSIASFAQYGSSGSVDARNMSLAKTYNASTVGLNSIGFNPANLIFTTRKVEFSTVFPLPSLAISTGTSFITINDIKYFFGGVDGKARYLNDADKQRLNDLFTDGGEVDAGVSLDMFSFMFKYDKDYGALSFGIHDFVGGKFRVPAALVDLGLNGNQFNKVYDFNDANMESWWIRNYTISYARELSEIPQDIFDRIAAGISLKIVQGFFYTGISKVNTTLLTSNMQNSISTSADIVTHAAFSEDFGMKYDFDSTTQHRKSSMSPFPTPAGTGLGFDIGFAADMKNWRFSAAITDIGSITWDKNPVEYTTAGSMVISDFSDQKQRDSLSDKFKSNGKYASSFSTNLPTALRLGASYAFNSDDDYIPGKLLLAFDINQGFNYSPGNTKKMRTSLGAEWIPWGWLNVRTGLSLGGVDGFNWAFGLGFDTGLVEFNFATSDMNSFVAANSAKRVSVSLGSKWKI